MRSNWEKLKSGTDIRGCASPQDEHEVILTTETARRVGYAFALWLSKKTGIPTDHLTVAVGHDARETGRDLAQGVIRGLTSSDADVYDCGLCTTPAMFLTTVFPSTHCDGAVMVTGSRQPWYVNGFKMIFKDGGLRGADIDEILEIARTATVPQRLVTPINLLDRYKESLKDMVRARLETDVQCPLLGLYVVVDAGNGAGGFYAELLEELGADVTGSRNLAPQPHLSDLPADPESPVALLALSRAVVENEADLGVLFDADCDRAAIVDARGRAINRNRLIALVSAILLNEKPGGTIVTDSVTSSGLQRFITEWSGVHYRFKRGYRNVIDEARRLNAEGIDCPLAIETSGHAALRENHFQDDGMYLVTRLLCEAVKRKREGETLCSLIDELHEPVESAEIRMNLIPEDYRAAAQSVIEAILTNTLDDPAWHLATDNREGVRITFDLGGGIENAWLQLRLSVHDPVMPINLESDVKGGVKYMLGALYELLKDYGDELDLSPLQKALAEAH